MTAPWPEGLLERLAPGEGLHPGGEAMSRRLLELCSFVAGGRVLDAGCGPGATLELLRRGGWRAVGVDRSPERVQRAALRGVAVEGSLEALPFADESFDGVLCECVLSQIEDLGRALGEFFRVLRPGGVLGVGDLFLPDVPREVGCGVPGCAGGARRIQDLERHIAEAGFELLVREDHSGAVRDLAVRLAWAGLLPETDCGDLRRGYALWGARKPAPETSDGRGGGDGGRVE